MVRKRNFLKEILGEEKYDCHKIISDELAISQITDVLNFLEIISSNILEDKISLDDRRKLNVAFRLYWDKSKELIGYMRKASNNTTLYNKFERLILERKIPAAKGLRLPRPRASSEPVVEKPKAESDPSGASK